MSCFHHYYVLATDIITFYLVISYANIMIFSSCCKILKFSVLTGSHFHQQSLIPWYVLVFSSFTLISHAIFHIVLTTGGDWWTTFDAQWAQLIGFRRCLNFLSIFL